MEAIKLVLLCLAISLASCTEDYEVVTLKNSDLSPESLEFFEFYENTDQMVFKKKGKSMDFNVNNFDRYEESKLTKAIDNDADNEYWIFNKVGDTEVEYKLKSAGYSEVFEGKAEERTIQYKDVDGNTLKFTLSNNSYIRYKTQTWKKLYEQFEIRYSAPCWTTLLRYKTANFATHIKDKRFGSIMHESKEVGNKAYDDLMELSGLRDQAHYKILASKTQGVVRILDQDNEITWDLMN